ncbi:MAG: hypothetical protein JF604_25720 [Bradyrhizobium sp.]|nr:hypothetical protein [Bradyrhizobium sp.]
MIDDMASLKQAMEQMDADDAAVAEAAKDRSAKILSDSKLNFSKMAELIEQRRLLLRPRIVTGIKRMDQPDALGDAAFRDTGALLRREGQSFRQIAEALELNSGTATRYEDTVHKGVALHQMEMESEPDGPDWPRAPTLVMRIAGYPFRHPIRFLTIALLAVLLFNGLRDFAGFERRISGYVGDVSAARERADAAVSSVSSFVEKRIMRPSQEATAPPTSTASPPSPSPATPSTGSTVTSAPPATAAGSSANESAPPASSTAQTPRLDARGVPPSNPAAKDRPQTVYPRALQDIMPARIRRNSRMAGPCIGGAGGCYWAGGQY